MSEQPDFRPDGTVDDSDWSAQDSSDDHPSGESESPWETAIGGPNGDADDGADDSTDSGTSDDDHDQSDGAAAAPAGAPTTARHPRTKTHITYDKLPRFEGRATPRQLRQVNALRIDLMAKRTRRGGPRITNNTLIRVALDGLLASRRDLTGNDEDELRDSFLQLLENGRNGAGRAAQPPASE